MTNIIKIHDRNGEIAISNPQEFLQQYNPKSVNERIANIRSTVDLIKSDRNSLALCKKKFGGELLTDAVRMHIVTLCESINVHQNLTENQVVELSDIILQDFYFLSINELAHIFRRAKRGEFGEFKFALNIGDVINWITTYQEERTQAFIERQEELHEKKKAEKIIIFDEETGESKVHRNNQIHPVIADALSKMVDKLPDKEEEYREYKKKIEQDPSHGLIDQSNNEDLQRMKDEINKKYGVE